MGGKNELIDATGTSSTTATKHTMATAAATVKVARLNELSLGRL